MVEYLHKSLKKKPKRYETRYPIQYKFILFPTSIRRDIKFAIRLAVRS